MTNVDIQLTLQVTYQKGTTVDENELRTMFQNYGPISDINTNSIGAFIDFKSHNDALTAMSAVNDQLTMKVTLAPGEGERLKLPLEVYAEPKIFVAPISPEWDEEAVRENFGQFGTVSEVVILNKGGAFVKYEKMRQAQDAIAHYTENPVQHPGANRIMKVSLATKKEDLGKVPTMMPSGKVGFETARPSTFVTNHNNAVQSYSPFKIPAQQAPQMNAAANTNAPLLSLPGGGMKGPVGANLFVHNHPTNFLEQDLDNLFSPYGQIISLSMQFDKATKQSKGYSFVSYNNPQSAKLAIQELNGAVFGGKKIEVSIKKGETSAPFLRPVIPDQRVMSPPRPTIPTFPSESAIDRISKQVPGGKLFVRVGAPINDEQLLRLFAPFGIVLECALQKDGTGRPKNFGFVNYDSVVSAVQAVKVLHGTVSPDSTVPLDVSIKKGEEHYAEPFLRMPMTKGPDGCNLFVRKIPDTWTEDDLVLRFSPFGEVWSVKINVDPKTGVKKGFGFVSYGNQQHAENAMAQMNGQTFEGRWTLNVSVKVPKATPN